MIICCHPDATVMVFWMRLVASLISAALEDEAVEQDDAVEVTCRRQSMGRKQKSDESFSAVATILPSLILWKAATNLPSFVLWKALKSTGRYVMANDFK